MMIAAAHLHMALADASCAAMGHSGEDEAAAILRLVSDRFTQQWTGFWSEDINALPEGIRLAESAQIGTFSEPAGLPRGREREIQIL
ncbi:hypothetical protein EYF80_014668 [Liparis tanakae]|uniref:Uncharacterized protein n=1 Tax=Liparis tanakae TaxID=230148 RepID=A0A4Z2ICA6_9TELE|nr:hypothetical protein EYF80_014668 [Liparis tanakae]